jgi:prolyl-tRNA synthetase
MIGGLIMGHGDDVGLRVPPRLASKQCVVLALRDEGAVVERSGELAAELRAAGIGVELDDKVSISFGRRATDWELKGVPVRLELGPRDLAEGVVTVVDRIRRTKSPAPLAGIADHVRALLDEQQAALLAEATERRESHTVDVTTLDDAVAAAATGWARIPWSSVGTEGEAVLAQSSVTVRCLVRPDGSLPVTGDEDDLVAIVARSY